MKDLLLPLLHLAVTAAKLCRPGGVRAVIAENLLLKRCFRHQLLLPRPYLVLTKPLETRQREHRNREQIAGGQAVPMRL